MRGLYSYNRVNQFTDAEDDGTAVPFASATYNQRSHQNYAELLYTSNDSKPFDFILGLNYFEEKLLQDIAVSINFLPVPVELIGDLTTRSYAFFGHGQLNLAGAAKLLRAFGIPTTSGRSTTSTTSSASSASLLHSIA